MLLIKLVLGIVHAVALSLFALKYLRFDVKSTISHGENNVSIENGSIIEEIGQELKKNVESEKFDRFIFFLLDAWRWDFLFSERTEMVYLKRKIMEGEAVGIVSLARIPTVTKPCLKSIFAGTHPVFFEIVENIDESGVSGTVSTGTSQDNLLQRLHDKGRKIAVYGDDVWGKLFPMSLFHRHNMSFGFNIMDFTEVDNLVHEGFEREKRSDSGSDVIILHYLGLDHIGHSYAVKDEYVLPKLREMDQKIEEVFEWARGKDLADGGKTLILMMGDHGMTHEGNHGGGSKEESQAGAVFMSPFSVKTSKKSDWRQAIDEAESDPHNQEDLASTLTALLDTSRPPLKFGNGCLIKRVMESLDDSKFERVQVLKNLKHLIEKLGPIKAPQIKDFSTENLYKMSEEIKIQLNSNSFKFDEFKLKCSVLALGAVLIVQVLLVGRKGCNLMNLESLIEVISMAILSVCQVATSFIGEEHLLWQGAFLANFLVFMMKSKEPILGGFKILILHRILCGWNGIGSMWVNEVTLSSYIKSRDNLKAVLVAAALIWILFKHFKSKGPRIVSHVSAAILVFIHRTWFPNHLVAQGVLVLLVTDWIVNHVDCKRYRYRVCTPVAILAVLLNKPINAVPVALILELVETMNELSSGKGLGMFLKLCTMQCAYYSLGLWNSVSAIDLTFGAIFSKRFDMRVAPLVLFFYTLSGPILVAITFDRNTRRPGEFGTLWFMRVLLDFGACAFAYNHRFHPWIFDFFSPKILFQIFWTAFYCLLLPVIELISR